MRGRVALLLAVLAAMLGVATGWREWTGIAAALAVLLLAAVVTALGRSSCAVALELDRRRFVVGDAGTSVVQVTNTAGRRMLPLRMELEVAGLPVTVRVPSLAPGGVPPDGDPTARPAAPRGGRDRPVACGPRRRVRVDQARGAVADRGAGVRAPADRAAAPARCPDSSATWRARNRPGGPRVTCPFTPCASTCPATTGGSSTGSRPLATALCRSGSSRDAPVAGRRCRLRQPRGLLRTGRRPRRCSGCCADLDRAIRCLVARPVVAATTSRRW